MGEIPAENLMKSPNETENSQNRISFRELSQISKLRQSPALTLAVCSLAMFSDMLIYGIIVPILPSILYDIGLGNPDNKESDGNAGRLGLLVGIYSLGLLVTTPIFVYLSTKSDGSQPINAMKFPMIVGLAFAIFSTLMFAYSNSFTLLAIARFLQGGSGGCTWTLALSLLSQVYPPNSLGWSMGIAMGVQFVGQILGPVMGGLGYENLGRVGVFWACVMVLLIDLFGRLWITPVPWKPDEYPEEDTDKEISPTDTYYAEESPTDSKYSPLQSLWVSVFNPILLATYLATISVSTLYSGLEPTLPLYLMHNFTSSNAEIGGILFALVVPNVAISALAGWLADKIGGLEVGTVGIFFMSLSGPLIALPKPIDSTGATNIASLAKVSGPSHLQFSWQVVLLILILMFFGSSTAVGLTPLLPAMVSEFDESDNLNGNYQEIVDIDGEFTGNDNDYEAISLDSPLSARRKPKKSPPHTTIYALFNIAYSFGMFLGPLISGPMYESLGFLGCLLVLCGVGGSMGTLGLLYGLKCKYQRQKRRYS